MDLSAETVALVAVVAAGGLALLLVAVVVLAMRLRRLRRAYAIALGADGHEDLFDAVREQRASLASLRQDVTTVHGNTEHLRELLRGTVSRVGLVRYDAFEDMGGALSFSAALLDERQDGVVISAINGRSETRCYAKPIRAGDSEHNLSSEEREALRSASEAPKGTARPMAGGRRRRTAS